jgi:hypothetical protein
MLDSPRDDDMTTRYQQTDENDTPTTTETVYVNIASFPFLEGHFHGRVLCSVLLAVTSLFGCRKMNQFDILSVVEGATVIPYLNI